MQTAADWLCSSSSSWRRYADEIHHWPRLLWVLLLGLLVVLREVWWLKILQGRQSLGILQLVALYRIICETYVVMRVPVPRLQLIGVLIPTVAHLFEVLAYLVNLYLFRRRLVFLSSTRLDVLRIRIQLLAIKVLIRLLISQRRLVRWKIGRGLLRLPRVLLCHKLRIFHRRTVLKALWNWALSTGITTIHAIIVEWLRIRLVLILRPLCLPWFWWNLRLLWLLWPQGLCLRFLLIGCLVCSFLNFGVEFLFCGNLWALWSIWGRLMRRGRPLLWGVTAHLLTLGPCGGGGGRSRVRWHDPSIVVENTLDFLQLFIILYEFVVRLILWCMLRSLGLLGAGS